MSNYHVLSTDEDQNRVNVIFHVPIPDEVNEVGTNYRAALKQYLEDMSEAGTIETQVPWDIGVELAQIQAGEIYEHRESYQFSNAHDVIATKRDELDAKFNQLVNTVADKVQKILSYWGLNRDVS